MLTNPYEELLQVVRIETIRSDGRHRFGTGFPHLFAIEEMQDDRTCAEPALVTNTHVIDDCIDGFFLMNRKDPDGRCRFGDTVKVKFEVKTGYIIPTEI